MLGSNMLQNGDRMCCPCEASAAAPAHAVAEGLRVRTVRLLTYTTRLSFLYFYTSNPTGILNMFSVSTRPASPRPLQVDWDAKRGELFEARAMPPWFTADTRLGVLCLTLEPPACFMAEEYAANLGYTNVPDDCKVRRIATASEV